MIQYKNWSEKAQKGVALLRVKGTFTLTTVISFHVPNTRVEISLQSYVIFFTALQVWSFGVYLGAMCEEDPTFPTVSSDMHLHTQLVTGHSECSLQYIKYYSRKYFIQHNYTVISSFMSNKLRG